MLNSPGPPGSDGDGRVWYYDLYFLMTPRIGADGQAGRRPIPGKIEDRRYC